MTERYLLPILPYLLMTGAFAVFMYLFFLLKKEIHSLRAALERQTGQARDAAAAATAEIEEMRAEFRAAEQRTAQLVPPPPIKSGLNLNRRTQVLRMFRHGEDGLEIARKLGLPRSEVALLIKVHKMAVDPPSNSDRRRDDANAPRREAAQ